MSPLPGLPGLPPNLGPRLDPYTAHNFLVEIDGLLVAGFSHVQGLESTIAVEDRVEGGVNDFVHKILKETNYPNLVLSHGLTDVDALSSWYARTARGVIQRKHMTLMLLDDRRLPVVWWDFRDALPIKWSGPAFDSTQDGQVAVESVELVHRGMTKSALAQAAQAARLASKLTGVGGL